MMLSAFILLYRITNLDPLGCERAVVPVDNNMYANKNTTPHSEGFTQHKAHWQNSLVFSHFSCGREIFHLVCRGKISLNDECAPATALGNICYCFTNRRSSQMHKT
jgi:hypothetical protein